MVKRALGALIPAFFVWLIADQYVISPTYAFEASKPFSGDSIHNPYRNYVAAEWTLANLHAHTSSWFGFTNGKGDANDVYEAYDSMGYGIHLISEYQKISKHGDSSASYISAYEHGFNIPKGHQLALGNRQVTWKDYLFPQTLSNKQDILNRLASDEGNVVVINHPGMRLGYKPTDFKFLSNYDCMEVLNSYGPAFEYWDTALSNGKMVSIVGNDDTHNAGNRKAVGKFATLIHAPGRKKDEVLRAMREGRTIGVQIPQIASMTFPEKIDMLKRSSPAIERVSVDSGRLSVRFSVPVYDLSITGQGGLKVYATDITTRIDFTIRPEDTYLRVSYMTSDSIRYFLNPVHRSNGRMGNRRDFSTE
jgi:hypothetical protein